MISKSARLGLLLLTIIVVTAGWTTLMAQEDIYVLKHDDVFAPLRRSAVSFPHGIHMEALDEEDCVWCHHVTDKDTGARVYRQGEEQGCGECHSARQKADTPTLREAYHAACTACHRSLITKSRQKAGPTTCGECHKKA